MENQQQRAPNTKEAADAASIEKTERKRDF